MYIFIYSEDIFVVCVGGGGGYLKIKDRLYSFSKYLKFCAIGVLLEYSKMLFMSVSLGHSYHW